MKQLNRDFVFQSKDHNREQTYNFWHKSLETRSIFKRLDPLRDLDYTGLSEKV